MTFIPHNDPRLADASVEVAASALRHARLSAGAAGESASSAVAAFVGSRHAAITSSGTAALHAALVGVGLGHGARVLVPTVTCPAVAHAVRATGATLELVDVGVEVPVLDPSMLAAHTPDAVIVPHMFGHRIDISPLLERGLLVIEDAAQALAPMPNSGAAASVLSFSPTKLLTAGYAGAVATDDDHVARRIQRFLSPDDEFDPAAESSDPMAFRINASLSGFQHELLRAELARYDEIVSHRSAVASVYRSTLPSCQHIPVHVPYRHLVRLPSGHDADDVVRGLGAAGIGAVPLGSHLLHRTFRIDGEFPNAERFRGDTVSLPMHHGVSVQDADRIAASLRTLLS